MQLSVPNRQIENEKKRKLKVETSYTQIKKKSNTQTQAWNESRENLLALGQVTVTFTVTSF